MKKFFLLFIIFFFLARAEAQVVDKQGIHTIELGDKSLVTVFHGFNDEGIHTYYYLPVKLRLSQKKEGTPEFSFLNFKSADGNQTEGAILHMLLVWGLTTVQEKEVANKLQTTIDSNAVLAGVIPLQNPQSIPSFQINGNSQVAKILGTKWSQPPVAAVFPGTKMALSYRLEANEAKLFEEALSHPSSLDSISVDLIFTYQGGNSKKWYNLIKGDNYIFKTELKTILNPVIGNQNK